MSFESDMEKFRNPDGGDGMSICWGDSYYYDSLVRKYGKKRVEDYLKKHPFIYDVPKNMW
jgi:hypothetical protein